MSQTLQNGITIATNSDPYNLIPDVTSALKSANVIAPIATQAAQDALTGKFLGMTIVRTDIAGQPMFQWNGTVWNQITGVRNAQYTGPNIFTTAGAGTTVGALTVDATKTIGNDFVQPDAAGRLKILKTGTYALGFILRPSAAPGKTNVYITDITAGAYIAAAVGGDYGTKETSVSYPNYYLTANTVIEFGFATSNAVNVGSLVSVSKWQ
jgi:hypothetical protein